MLALTFGGYLSAGSEDDPCARDESARYRAEQVKHISDAAQEEILAVDRAQRCSILDIALC